MEELISLREENEQLKKELSQLKENMKEEYIIPRIRKKTYYSNQNDLSNEEIERYHRHIILPEISLEGQKKLCSSNVLIVGLGGLGSSCALYLSTCGISHLGFCDFDIVESCNLNRQVIHSERSIGMNKAKSAQVRCQNLNPLLKVTTFQKKLSKSNAKEIISEFDVICDCTDNVKARYLINDCCVLLKKPLVSGSSVGTEGQMTVYNYEIDSKKGPCYRCLFPVPPPRSTVRKCREFGVLGVCPGIIGAFQSLEVQKIILGMPGILVGKMLLFDATTSEMKNVRIRMRSRKCPICVDNPKISDLEEEEERKKEKTEISLESLSVSFSELSKMKNKLIVDVRRKSHFEICHYPEAINIPLRVISDENFQGFEKKNDEVGKFSSELKDLSKEVILMGNNVEKLEEVICSLSKNGGKVMFVPESTEYIHKYIENYPKV